jgi:hypothetical protein
MYEEKSGNPVQVFLRRKKRNVQQWKKSKIDMESKKKV